MTKKILFLIALPIVIISAKHVYAQSFKDVFPAVVYLEQQEKVKTERIEDVECEIWIKKPTEKDPEPLYKKTYGTAFFVASGKNNTYLVTAEHVANQMRTNAKVIIQDEGDRPFALTLKDLWNKSEDLKWEFHGKADVAVLPLSPSQEIKLKLKRHFLGLQHIEKVLEAPKRTSMLTMIGFPLGLGTEGYFSPISLEVKVTSGLLNMPRADTNEIATFFLLDKPSAGGYSGAPIFKLPITYLGEGVTIEGSDFKCLGLVHGTISDKTGGKFTAVVPAAYIVETIDRFEKEK